MLQLAACAVFAWAWVRAGPDTGYAALLAPTESAQTAGVQTLAARGGETNRSADPNTLVSSAQHAPPTAALADPALRDASTMVIVSRSDTLDRIFRRLKLDLADLATMRSLPHVRELLDRLRPGEALRLVHRGSELFGFERRLSPAQTLRVVRSDSGFRADVLENPLATRTRTVRGVIDSSLFEAVNAAGAHDPTALALAEIFGWDIDFVLDIQPGDSFVVTYQEFLQDGAFLKDGPVLAALFVNKGRAYRAVRYVDPTGSAHYYTPEGRSMYRAFIRAPLEFTRVSSRFNPNRRHPILNTIRAHQGVDYAAPIGTPVKAAGDGRVRFAGLKGGYGNVLEIEHTRGIVTVYGHLSRFAKGTRVGQRVTQGAVVAYVGMTGLATGPHLHYEYRVNGVFKNPQTVQLPDAAPIDPQYRADFVTRATPLLAALEAPLGPALVSR